VRVRVERHFSAQGSAHARIAYSAPKLAMCEVRMCGITDHNFSAFHKST